MKKLTTNYPFMIMCLLVSLIHMSCSKMFDSLKDFADEESIYPASFDTIAGKIGFERVEIDLSTKGRIAASQMKLSKAGKTVVTSSYFENPLVIDTVSSWVNITGLTEPEEYTFRIYTEDEFGNRSIPKEIALVPYTTKDLEQLELIPPRITSSSSSAVLEWESPLSGVAFDCYSYSYKYTDKDGVLHTGEGQGDRPNIIAENLARDQSFPVEIKLRIVPIKNGQSIIDTIDWTSTISLRIPPTATDAIFLKFPISLHTIDLNVESANAKFPFSWTAVNGINAYSLKISTTSTFETANTLVWDVGNVSEIELGMSDVDRLISTGSGRFYWTVVPTVGNASVVNQIRSMTIYRAIRPSGMWLFDDPSDLFKATIGNNLTEVSLVANQRIVASAGPKAGDGAVYVPERSYLTCPHGIPVKQGETRVNEYTLSMTIKIPSLKWYSILDIDETNNNGEFFISPNGEIGIDGSWNISTMNMSINVWHTITYSVVLGSHYKMYIDGKHIKTISSVASDKNGRYALRPNTFLYRDDATWNNVNTSNVSEVIFWGMALNDLEIAQMNNIKFR